MSKKTKSAVADRRTGSSLAEQDNNQASSSLVLSGHREKKTANENVLGIEVLSNPRDAEIE